MKQYKLEELGTYQLAMQLGEEIWQIATKWNYLAVDTIGKQIIRSSDSIASNIAEGYGRYFYKGNKQFCFYSRGSILETKTWLRKARNRNLITEEVFDSLIKNLETIHIKLNTYIKFIDKNQTVTNKLMNK